MADETPRVVTVEIMGKRYPLTSTLDLEYITGLAEYVDEKIQSATDNSTGSDAIRVTVLAALNIADEYFRSRDTDAHHETELQRRAGAIEQMVDRALEQFD